MTALAPPPTTVTDVLAGARRLLAEGRHLQGMLYDHRGGYCLGGALAAAAGYPVSFRYGPVSEAAALLAARNAMPGVGEDAAALAGATPEWAAVVLWNNAAGRTKDEVLEALDRALAA